MSASEDSVNSTSTTTSEITGTTGNSLTLQTTTVTTSQITLPPPTVPPVSPSPPPPPPVVVPPPPPVVVPPPVSPPPPVVNPSATGILVIAYNNPGSTWTALAMQAQEYPNVPVIVVINPDSGPGTSQQSAYTTGIATLQAAPNVQVLGYVPTSNGTRALTGPFVGGGGNDDPEKGSVEGDSLQWKTWYPKINGIFFDEADPQSDSYVTYYSEAAQYVKSLGMTFVMCNPGTTLDTSYVGGIPAVNSWCIYEDSGEPTQSELTNGGAYTKAGLPKSLFSCIVNTNSASSSFPNATQLAMLIADVGYVYIDSTDAEYDAISTFMGQMFAALSAVNPPLATVQSLAETVTETVQATASETTTVT